MGKGVITLGKAVGLVATGLGGYPQEILEQAAEELDRLAAFEGVTGDLLYRVTDWAAVDEVLNEQEPGLVPEVNEWREEWEKRTQKGLG